MNKVPSKVDNRMADTDNPEALPGPRVARFGEGSKDKAARRERGASGPRMGLVGRLSQFVKDVRAELKRVSWPSARDVKNTTIITLIAVVFFAIYLFAVDQAWTFLITQLNTFLNWLAVKIAGA